MTVASSSYEDPSRRSGSTSPATMGDAELLHFVASASSSPTGSPPTGGEMPPPPLGGYAGGGSNNGGGEGPPLSKPDASPSSMPQQLVDHTYSDYGIVDEDDLRLLDEKSSLLPKASSSEEEAAREKLKGMVCTYGPMKKNAGGVIQPFPGKLLDVLDRGDLTEVIDWMPHGRAFIVKKPKLFASDVLPRFFKQTKFLSFTRQLNLWGFKRITKGVDAGAYYHQLFLRGRPYLAMRMRRQKIKGTGMKLTPNPEGEPDFYKKISPVPPLSSRRILPPLPPLPADRVGQGYPTGVSTLDRTLSVSHRMPGGGMYPLRETSSSLYGHQGDQSSFKAAAESQVRQSVVGAARGGPGGCVNDDLLLAPGVSPLDSASRLQYSYLESCGGASAYGGGTSGGSIQGPFSGKNPSSNDPIHDELSAMMRTRAGTHPTPPHHSGMYPPSAAHLTSDRFLMERIRDLDRAALMKREQDDFNIFRRARLLEEMGAQGASHGPMPGPTQRPIALPLPSHGLGSGGDRGWARGGNRYDHYYSDFASGTIAPPTIGTSIGIAGTGSGCRPPPPHTSSSAGATASAGAGDPYTALAQDMGPSSVTDALREANHLEELAAVQRAKARSLALAGALHRYGLPEGGVGTSSGGGGPSNSNGMTGGGGGGGAASSSSVEGAAAAAAERSSFGRPFGRRDM